MISLVFLSSKKKKKKKEVGQKKKKKISREERGRGGEGKKKKKKKKTEREGVESISDEEKFLYFLFKFLCKTASLTKFLEKKQKLKKKQTK